MRRLLLGLGLLLVGGTAVAQHHHSDAKDAFAADSREAFTATPAFGPDGTLWLVRANADRVVVVKSNDLGRSFSAPVAVTPQPMNLDWGPDARARIAVDPKGGVVVTFAIFQDKRFNGRAFSARSSDNGASFTRPQPLTADTTSQRFENVAIDPAGRVFAAWLDKRNVAPAVAAGRPYPGAALAYAWSDDGAAFGDTSIALDNTCECCRLGIAFARPGRPVIAFRNIFDGSIRDHAVVAFTDATTPGPLRRVSVDDWKLEACPHQGPSLASSPDRQPARPYLLASGQALHLVWKEFDGTKALVRWQVSHDSGRSWSAVRTVADTDDASDHPLLVAHAGRAYLSWLTKTQGYRLIPLEDQP
jgi:hypothetical protein